MRKILSLFAAVLFAGSIFAADVTFKFDSIADANSWANATAYSPVTVAPITLTANGGGNNAKYYESDESWRMYNGGSLEITAAAGYEVTAVSSTPAQDFTISEGKATLSFSATVKFTKIIVSYKEANPDEPAIAADDVNFGTRVIEDDEFVLDTTLAVAGANLTAAIAATGSDHVTVSGALTAEGGTLNLHIVAAKGDFSEEITLTSGELTKKVKVIGKVIKTVVAPGTPATMTAGTNAQAATVNSLAAVKVGKSSEDGDMTITVPAKAAKLHFFALAWNNAAGTIGLTAPTGVTLDLAEVTLVADAGIAGSSTDYVLNGEVPAYFTVNLTGVTAETAITLASGTARRFVVWGATYELEEEPATTKYCELATGHLGQADFGDANGRILLTIQKVKDTNNIRVAIKNNAAAGNTKEGLNYLWVNLEGAAGVVRYGDGTHAEADVEEVSVVIELAEAKENYNFINIHWAYSGWEGEWAIDGLTVAATELCDTEYDPTAIDNTVVSEKAIKMFENGQLVIIKNGVKYNALGSVIE